MSGRKNRPVRDIPAATQDVVLVCRKCLKKMKGGGFGPAGDERLDRALEAAALAAAVAAGNDRPQRVAALRGKARRRRLLPVLVGTVACLKICPKDAVMAISCAQPGQWLAVPRGTAAGDVAARLGLAFATRPAEPGAPATTPQAGPDGP